MCLIVFAWKVIPGVPLIAAANRDEYYERASAPAAAWPEHPQVYAGRDLQAGGSWMGITREGAAGSRFAAITNIRSPRDRRSDAPSRGTLVADYLAGGMTAPEYIAQLEAGEQHYNGYNLILGDRDTLYWYSNRGQDDARNGRPLEPGIYGLSNALLDAPWPKVLKTKAQFASLLCQGAPDEAYFEMLADTTRAPDLRLPETGVPLDLERILSAVRIETPGYGTRTSTVVKLYAEAPGELHELFIQ
ncbi:NRDE family protein [Janthinobacterium fluminis]|uniref:NRDE family protein n=1 Tax=Janthinobacterium fluminis TaxID=2987524 RepID=A0ABT5JY47_9BURK|nr:NRDE family protein [Janthinobacterium fluminis]MDC8756971.1 NRDE family protein [Janthinobacterium fluminis]